jgi:6,7-dimethyl-8-ribityllumazine synthase
MKLEGSFETNNYKIAIVTAKFNELITMKLHDGAVSTLKKFGLKDTQITECFVPGAFELPLTCKMLAESRGFDAVIAIGAVIKGDTDHYHYVCNETAKGISNASLTTGVPVIFGVLTVDTLEQAFDRSGAKAGNKGSECAHTAIEMASLAKKIKSLS